MAERDWTRVRGLRSRMRCTSRKSRNLTLGLAEKKRRSVRHSARSILSRLPRTRCRVHDLLPAWRWFTRGRASATERWSNSKLSRRFRPVHHTAICASIRAGILCAAIRATTRSSPQPKLPANSWKWRRRLLFYSAHAKHCYQRSLWFVVTLCWKRFVTRAIWTKPYAERPGVCHRRRCR